MPSVTDDMREDALRCVRYLARRTARKRPGLDPDELESAGGEAIVEAEGTWDPARATWLTHVKTVAGSRMTDALRAHSGRPGRRPAAARLPEDPETGEPLPLADRRQADPAALAAAREPLAAPGRRVVSVSRLRGELPPPDVVADKVAALREAMFAAVTPADVGAVMAGVVEKARGGDLKAAKLLLDYLQPGRSGVTVQQAVVINPGDVS